MDMGTGLAENTVRKALEELCKLGYIEKMERLGYRPRLRPTQTKPAARRADPDGAFLGFAPPSENYFKIPKEWTDITCEISSAATLLCVEYFIRHAWGWHNPTVHGWKHPRWHPAAVPQRHTLRPRGGF
jgi:hypothetical protein